MLKLDLSKLNGFLPEDYLTSREERLAKAAEMVASHTGPGGDFTGWVFLPRDYDKEEFARIQAAAKKIQQDVYKRQPSPQSGPVCHGFCSGYT